jgi:hypothetical protein
MSAPPTADLQARLDAGIDALVDAINAGERPWVGLGAPCKPLLPPSEG